MKRKIRQAYIRGMIDISVWLIMMYSYVQFGMYAIEKYFM